MQAISYQFKIRIMCNDKYFILLYFIVTNNSHTSMTHHIPFHYFNPLQFTSMQSTYIVIVN